VGRGRARLRGGVAAQPKWVASRSLKSVGANATLAGDDVAAFARRLKVDVEGDIDVAGPDLAGSLTDLAFNRRVPSLLPPFVLGRGKPYFASARAAAPPCRHQSGWRGRGQADVRPRLIALAVQMHSAAQKALIER